MSADAHKKAAAAAALELVRDGCRLGVGTGSTVNHFIAALPALKSKPSCVVASSEASARLLEQSGIRTVPLDRAGGVDLYVDGADEIDGNLQMIKGGGGAHTREKILACCAGRFIVIADGSKKVARLGAFPLPVEVIPMARGLVARALAALGGAVQWREGVVTDNGNWILDVRGLDLTAAAEREREINQLTGVVENGLFAQRRADRALIADGGGVHTLTL